jgi:hypothetical protein
MMTVTPSALLRGVLFVLLACSLLVNPVAAPAAFFEEDGTAPREEAEEDGLGRLAADEREEVALHGAEEAAAGAAGEPPVSG